MKGKTAQQAKGKAKQQDQLESKSAAYPTKRTRGTAYPTELKIKACVAALTTNADHPTSIDAMNAAKAVLNADVASSVMVAWLAEYKSQITALMPVKATTQELVTAQYNETIQAWSNVEKISLEHLIAGDKIKESSARDAAVVAGIARTHLAKMISLDAGLVDSVTKLQAICQRMGLDVKALIDDYTAVLERRTLPQTSVNPSPIEIEPGSEE